MGNIRTVPLFLSSNNESLHSILRVVNHSNTDGVFTILACDDIGNVFGPLTIPIRALQTLYIDSTDLEGGNPAKGIFKGIGKGQGDWHLYLRSLLEIEIIVLVKQPSGFLTPIHDTITPDEEGHYHVALLNLDDSSSDSYRLRIVNLEREKVDVDLRISNRRTNASSALVRLILRSSEALEINPTDLVRELAEVDTFIGRKFGLTTLKLTATFDSEATKKDPEIHVMYLQKIPEHSVSNLSARPLQLENGAAHVPYFPSPSEADQRTGLLRLVNNSKKDGKIKLTVWNETGEVLGRFERKLHTVETVQFATSEIADEIKSNSHTPMSSNSEDSWRLEIRSDLALEMSAFVVSNDGTTWLVHDAIKRAGDRYRVHVVNPSSDPKQDGFIRLVNVTQDEARVDIRAINRDAKTTPLKTRFTLLPGHTIDFPIRDLVQSHGQRKNIQLFNHPTSEWLLTSDNPIIVQSMLVKSDGHVSNLSAIPNTHEYDDEFPDSDLMHVFNENVLVMHVDHDVTEPLEDPPIRYAAEIYKHFDDVFDFLILLPNVDNWYSTNESTFGRYFGVMNDVQGIGRTQFLDTRYGSAGSLRGVVLLNFSRALIHGPLLHELHHAWANFVIPTSVPSHWGFSSANGQLGGFDHEQLKFVNDGVYSAGTSWNPRANGGNSMAYSPIELYLSGFLTPDQVPDLWVAPTGHWYAPSKDESENGTQQSLFSADFTEIYTIEDIIEEHGKRIPSAENSPKTFRAVVVLLVDERQPLFTDDIEVVSEHARIFSEPAVVNYKSCRFRDTFDGYPYTRQCSDEVSRPWFGPLLVSSQHRYLNYFEATGGRATLTLKNLSHFVRARSYPRRHHYKDEDRQTQELLH